MFSTEQLRIPILFKSQVATQLITVRHVPRHNSIHYTSPTLLNYLVCTYIPIYLDLNEFDYQKPRIILMEANEACKPKNILGELTTKAPYLTVSAVCYQHHIETKIETLTKCNVNSVA